MRRLALIALVAAAAAGCGGEDGDDRRQALADYIREANTAQQRSATAYAEADAALRAFAIDGEAGARSARELEGVVETLAQTRTELGRLQPPPEAAKLHRDTLRLVDGQAALARDLQGLAAYLPDAGEALGAAEAARARLQRSLGASDTAAGQAEAARTYARSAAAAAGDLRALDPPQLLQDWHTRQLVSLGKSRELAEELATALDAGDVKAIETVLGGFGRISREATTTARAQVTAVRAFNRRVRQQRALVAAISREQRRLDRVVR